MNRNIIEKEIVEEDGIKYEVTKITNSDGEVIGTIKNPYSENMESLEPEEPIEEISSEEMQAQLLLNQIDIIARQEEQDAVLAEILLNQMGGETDV